MYAANKIASVCSEEDSNIKTNHRNYLIDLWQFPKAPSLVLYLKFIYYYYYYYYYCCCYEI